MGPTGGGGYTPQSYTPPNTTLAGMWPGVNFGGPTAPQSYSQTGTASGAGPGNYGAGTNQGTYNFGSGGSLGGSGQFSGPMNGQTPMGGYQPQSYQPQQYQPPIQSDVNYMGGSNGNMAWGNQGNGNGYGPMGGFMQPQNYGPPSFAQLFGGGGFGGNYGFNPSGGNMWGAPQNNYGVNPSGGNMWPGQINKSTPTGGVGDLPMGGAVTQGPNGTWNTVPTGGQQWQPPQTGQPIAPGAGGAPQWNGPTAMGGALNNYAQQYTSGGGTPWQYSGPAQDMLNYYKPQQPQPQPAAPGSTYVDKTGRPVAMNNNMGGGMR